MFYQRIWEKYFTYIMKFWYSYNRSKFYKVVILEKIMQAEHEVNISSLEPIRRRFSSLQKILNEK